MQANREARRVLRARGHYVVVVWDRLDRNAASQIASDAVAALFPDDPPLFLPRTPFGYTDVGQIEADLRAAHFEQIAIKTVELHSNPSSPSDAATGLVAGCPLAPEVEEREPGGVGRAVDAAASALEQLNRGGRFESTLSAHVVTATR